MDEDVDVEARDRAAGAVVRFPQPPCESAEVEGVGAEVTFNPLHAASVTLVEEHPALLPGWQRRTDPATQAVFFMRMRGGACACSPRCWSRRRAWTLWSTLSAWMACGTTGRMAGASARAGAAQGCWRQGGGAAC